MRFSASLGLSVFVATMLVSASLHAQDSKAQNATGEMPAILFVCEHGAAKSVIAAAYFEKLAKERGLKYRAIFRGTNPDPALAPVAVKGLNEDGIDTSGRKPELVAKKDMDQASGIVTLGCALPGGEVAPDKVTAWNDIPSPSQNYQAARDEIVKKVRGLVDDLAKKERKKKPRR